MDRFLVDLSIDDRRLTRSLSGASTSGFIRDDPPHWAVEPYLPIQTAPLIEYLVDRGELRGELASQFRRFSRGVDSLLHSRAGSYHCRFAAMYAPLDPDSDCLAPAPDADADADSPAPDPEAPLGGGEDHLDDRDPIDEPRTDPIALGDPDRADCPIESVMSFCAKLLDEAGYRQLRREDVEQCAGIASAWGVPLQVNFDLFEKLAVYARGDIIGTRVRRRLRNFYRLETFEIPVYQRMAVLFELRDDDASHENLKAATLHLRMFKNIPKQDIDMLLPGTRVRISGFDRIKIIVPSLGGFLMSARKIAQYAILFAALALHWTAILVVLVVGYLAKTVFSYFQTKSRYELSLTRNLYFQKLDANAGVGHRVVQQAHRQAVAEMVLAYYALLTSDEPTSSRKLRRRCERLIREAVDVEVAFRIDTALNRLVDAGAAVERSDHWQATEPVLK